MDLLVSKGSRFGGFVLLLAGSSCSLVGGSETTNPVLFPEPNVELRIKTIQFEPLHWAFIAPPTSTGRVDELLASPVMRDPEFQEAVDDWIEYWENAARPWFPEFLRRMSIFEEMVDSVLDAKELPTSLRYLPLIESGYNPRARSYASAVGMWQFMPGTAREHGMTVAAFVDERRDPFKSTDAAAEYLSSLYRRFDSWFLALASYNGGPNRAQRILRQNARLEQPSDSLFWALRQHWPRETREFVPKLVGAIIVAKNLESYGYEPPERAPPFRYTAVKVPDATTLDVLAQAAEAEEDEIRWLNPELFRGFTPPGEIYELRVPEGQGEIFTLNYAAIPQGERMTVVEHSVEHGETLSHISVKYGISVRDLQAANPRARPRYLRVGMRLTVPILINR